MSGKAFGWAREQRCSGGVVAKAVLLLIADYARADDTRSGPHECFPSIATLADELGAHERTVQRAIRSLEDDGLIEREERASSSGKATSNRYFITFEEPRQSATPSPGAAPPLPPAQRHPHPGAAPGSTTFEPLKVTDEGSDEPSGSFSEGARALEDAGSPDFEGLPGDRARRAERDRAEAAYERLTTAWAERQGGRVHEVRDRLAFSAALAEGVDPDLLVEWALRFLGVSPDAKPPRLPMLDGWIKGKRWRGFEARAGEAGGGAAASRFDAPAELVALLRSDRQRDWIAYLTGQRWDADARAIVVSTDTAAKTLLGAFGADFAELNITVIVRKAA